jgi:hypothetical protein
VPLAFLVEILVVEEALVVFQIHVVLLSSAGLSLVILLLLAAVPAGFLGIRRPLARGLPSAGRLIPIFILLAIVLAWCVGHVDLHR